MLVHLSAFLVTNHEHIGQAAFILACLSLLGIEDLNRSHKFQRRFKEHHLVRLQCLQSYVKLLRRGGEIFHTNAVVTVTAHQSLRGELGQELAVRIEAHVIGEHLHDIGLGRLGSFRCGNL